MRKFLALAAVAFSFACFVPTPAALAVQGGGPGAHRLGFGVNYYTAIGDLPEKIDRDGLSYLVSYQYAPSMIFKIEGALELFPDLAGSGNPVLAPLVFATVGGLFYAGVGVGIYYHSGDFGDSPFYMLRAGVDFPILPRLFLDINANYRFNDWRTIEWADVDRNTIRLGAALRFTL